MYNGVINIYKEKGYTSHDVSSIIGKHLKAKTGHTGTLDPEAEGVLPVCVGKATRLCDYIMAAEKQYICECTLGVTTDTQDHTGNIIAEKSTENIDAGKIKDVVSSFIGGYDQLPPMYSALKLNGKKLYEIAREGKTIPQAEIEQKRRFVNIYNIEILDIKLPAYLKLAVNCGKGAYIRTLCNDIGGKLGCGGHMSSLIRSMSGAFNIANSIKLENFKQQCQNGKINDIIIQIEQIVSAYKKVFIKQCAVKRLYNGNLINMEFAVYDKGLQFQEGEILSVFDDKNRFSGLYKFNEASNTIKAIIVFPPE